MTIFRYLAVLAGTALFSLTFAASAFGDVDIEALINQLPGTSEIGYRIGPN